MHMILISPTNVKHQLLSSYCNVLLSETVTHNEVDNGYETVIVLDLGWSCGECS